MPTSLTENFIHKIMRGEQLYPARLNDLYDPPACIYTSGNAGLLNQPMIAIVDSRKASVCGLKTPIFLLAP